MNALQRVRTVLYVLSALLPVIANAQTSGFTVTAAHPRLFWNADRIAQAKTWYASHPFTPSAGDPFANALRYVLTGETSYARTAINWLGTFRLPGGQVLPTAIGCDECRWSGENAMIVFDWCYDQMTPGERTAAINLYNTYWGNVNQQDWGGVGMEGNNYYWGNMRNSLEWGITSFGDNAPAQSFLDNALITRWKNSFLPYAATGSADGGVLAEGPNYGCTMLSYPIIPFISTELMGRGIFHESAFFQEALISLLYSTTPSPVINGAGRYYDFFPFNESEVEDIIHTRKYFGDFMMTMANHWETIPLGQYARRWVNLCNPSVTNYIQSVNQTGREKSFSSLPLDYYAPGIGYLYARNRWDTLATALHIQMRQAEGVGHAHIDWSHFQLFRKGRWLTRETSGYTNTITGVDRSSVDVALADGHNSIFIGPALGQSIAPLETRGLARAWTVGPPVVKRVESRPDYCYSVVDLTNCYHSTNYDLFENKHAGKVVREYVFVRPLEALVVFDRIQSISTLIPAASVVKMAAVHFETNPVIQDANHVLATVGTQAIRLTTVVPSAPAYQVVDEGGTAGQYRLQISTSGAAQSYFINVLQCRDASDANLTTNLTENASSFQVELVHPALGRATLVLQKGDTSSGGSFAYSTTGAPANFIPFLGRVQGISVDDNGPAWESSTAAVRSSVNHERASLHLNAPALIRSSAVITFQVPAFCNSSIDKGLNANQVELSIYNASGKMVHCYKSNLLQTGSRRIVWHAAQQGAGMYYVKLIIGPQTLSRKILLVK